MMASIYSTLLYSLRIRIVSINYEKIVDQFDFNSLDKFNIQQEDYIWEENYRQINRPIKNFIWAQLSELEREES